jgi:leucyl/phenylalanyl-tRNA---protein transferase
VALRVRTMNRKPKFRVPEIFELYSQGYFLMDNGNGLDWYSSRRHALVPLDDRFHTPTSLRRALNSGRFEIRINAAFEAVVDGCAAREETWITPELRTIYLELHAAGVAHSFETWFEGQLAGGILGIVIGGAFIGESMFFRVPESSKVAMVRLHEHLKAQGFVLFDAQIQNPHLERFGAYEVNAREYAKLLERAIAVRADFLGENGSPNFRLEIL